MASKRVKLDGKFPHLHSAISHGYVKVIDGQYVGIASDGAEVAFGTVGYDETQTERYLTACPKPEQW